ncbi:MAG: hypothetical protein NTX51_02120 [Verrucomicrobia bacterium]|nr:hypothetical protein [Verrucomicrobiota bacterium]
MASTSSVMPPLPHIAILVCVLQYGLGPWAAHYYPAANPEYAVSNPERYFAYAVPALVAIAFGWFLGCIGLYSRPQPQYLLKGHSLAERDLNRLLWGGLALHLILRSRELGGLGVLFLLLANLRFVGAMGLMLLRAPGWKWKAMLLLILELSASVGSGLFHDMILWAMSFFALYAFTRRISRPAYLMWLALIALSVFLLNDAKWQIRQSTWFGGGAINVFGSEVPMNRWNRPFVGGLCLAQSATKLLSGGFGEDSLGDACMRFNQGWIVDRVLQHVPANEPYARGETVLSSLKAALLPRILAPDKRGAGGREFMTRFADYTPFEDTSMSIGFVGEIYANFGRTGGILGCGVYALLLALGFRLLGLRARKSVVWWSLVFYIAHLAIKAETDIGTAMNYVVKAAVVALAAVYCLPHLRYELLGRAGQEPGKLLKRRAGPRLQSGSVAADVPSSEGSERVVLRSKLEKLSGATTAHVDTRL